MTPDWDAKSISVPYANFGDPQTLNLYNYVENAPLNRVDADGHYPSSPAGDVMNNGQQQVDVQGTSYALSAGHTTVYYLNGRPAGYWDYWDFDSKSWGQRSTKA